MSSRNPPIPASPARASLCTATPRFYTGNVDPITLPTELSPHSPASHSHLFPFPGRTWLACVQNTSYFATLVIPRFIYGRGNQDLLEKNASDEGRGGGTAETKPGIPVCSLRLSLHLKFYISWMKLLGKPTSKNCVVIWYLMVMTNFRTPRKLPEIRLFPRKYQVCELLEFKMLVGAHHIHRNSWKPREQLLWNRLPVAQPSEIHSDCPMLQGSRESTVWYYGRTITWPLNGIPSGLRQKEIFRGPWWGFM